MIRKYKILILAILLSLSLTSCIPTFLQPVIRMPIFNIQAQGITIVDIQPPLFGNGNLVLKVPMNVYNPNNVELYLDRIDFDLFVNSHFGINSSFSNGFLLNAGGSAPLELYVTIPVLQGIDLASDVVGIIEGRPTTVRVDGSVMVRVLDNIRVFAKTTLLSARIN